MTLQNIRILGDPVLKQRAQEVTDIDGAFVRTVESMFSTMYKAPGIGLAAPQVGIQQRFFIYDHDDNPGILINPEIVESSGEWVFEEGCLSLPGLYFEIVRPKEILLRARSIDGNEIEIEADTLTSRLFQHELDHLNGVLMTEHLVEEQKSQARKALRELQLGPNERSVEERNIHEPLTIYLPS